MFAECDLIIENDDHSSVHGKYINTQLVWGEYIYPKIIIIIQSTFRGAKHCKCFDGIIISNVLEDSHADS